MDALQNELDGTYPLLNIQIIGVNETGHESANSLMTSGRDLPWLQDVDADNNTISDVWYDQWQVGYRDVVILDGANSKIGIFNVTEHNLADAAKYAALRTQLLDAALSNQKPWQNPEQPMDCDNDGVVAPRDVLVVINTINADGARKLPAPTGNTWPEFRYDANGDGFVAPGDVLQVINYINAYGNNGEGESASSDSGSGGEPFAEALIVPAAWIAEQRTNLADVAPTQIDCEWTHVPSIPPQLPHRLAAAPEPDDFAKRRPELAVDDSFWSEDWLTCLPDRC